MEGGRQDTSHSQGWQVNKVRNNLWPNVLPTVGQPKLLRDLTTPKCSLRDRHNREGAKPKSTWKEKTLNPAQCALSLFLSPADTTSAPHCLCYLVWKWTKDTRSRSCRKQAAAEDKTHYCSLKYFTTNLGRNSGRKKQLNYIENCRQRRITFVSPVSLEWPSSG